MKNTALFLLLSTAFAAKVTVSGITCGQCSSTVKSCPGQVGSGANLKCIKSTGTVKEVCYSGYSIASGNPGFCGSYPTGSVTIQDCEKDYKGVACPQKTCFTSHGGATTTATSTTAGNAACLSTALSTGASPVSWTCSSSTTTPTPNGGTTGTPATLSRTCYYSKALQTGSGPATTIWGQACQTAVQVVTFAATGTTITNTITEATGAICLGASNPLLSLAKELLSSTKASGQMLSLAIMTLLLLIGNL